ncbi:MAG: response regulator transcription factor [Acidimicrobiales bacterium]
MTDNRRYRVIVADDHPIWISGLRADLGDEFDVVGEAADAAAAIALIDELSPDLALCDLHMPEGGGMRVAQQRGDATNVVILTVSEDERDVLDAVAVGALGYLTKSTEPGELATRSPGRRRRTGLLGVAGRAGPHRVPPPQALRLSGERTHRTVSGRCSSTSPGALLSRDRRGALHLPQDGREPHPQHPREAAPVEEAGADALRPRARDRVTIDLLRTW